MSAAHQVLELPRLCVVQFLEYGRNEFRLLSQDRFRVRLARATFRVLLSANELRQSPASRHPSALSFQSSAVAAR